jgi:hypothetical protein
MDVVTILQQYGFPTLAAIAMGYFIFFVYNFITKEVKVKLSEMNVVLIGLIDRIRMLDNDLIRLRSKIDTAITLKEKNEKRK